MRKADVLSYQTENFPRIVERVKYFKVQKEGVTIMCEIADRIRQEGLIAGKIESILNYWKTSAIFRNSLYSVSTGKPIRIF